MKLNDYLIGYLLRLYGAKYTLYEYVMPDKFRTLCSSVSPVYNFGSRHFIFRAPENILNEFGHTDRDNILGRINISLMDQKSCDRWIARNPGNDLYISENCMSVFYNNYRSVLIAISNDATWHDANAKSVTVYEAFNINEFLKFKLIKRVH